MKKKSTISKQKGVLLVADELFKGVKSAEIVRQFAEKYGLSASAIEKWVKPARIIAADRNRELEEHTRAMIKESREDMVKRLGLDMETVLAEYKKLAYFDLRKVYDDKNALIDIKQFDDASAAAVAGIEVLEVFEGTGKDKKHIGNTVKLKIADKRAALDSICNVLGYDAPTKISPTDPEGNALPNMPPVVLNLPPGMNFILPSNTEGDDDQ